MKKTLSQLWYIFEDLFEENPWELSIIIICVVLIIVIELLW